MTIQPGRNLLNYELAEQIGEGGMGVVWRARDTKLDRDVAIKILPADFAQDRDRLARFEREAKLLASLNHANIATIHGLEHDSGLHFLAMELIEGEELATRIGRGAIPVEEALPLARQIASALEAAHERGVIHRDLKPANIKITPEGSVKVLDFGLAKALVDSAEDAEESLAHSPTLTAATRAGVILGTAGYMSPEQARGKPVNKRTDIWAFGCVLYEMLTGRQAFEGETVSDVIAKILEREPDWQELPVQTPLKIRELVLRCVRRDHRDRLHDIADARIEIDEVLAAPSDRVATSRGSSGDEAVSQRPARHVLPWTIAVLVSLLAGLLGMRLLQLTPRDLSPEWFAIVPPNSVSSVGPEPAVSPDGRTVAFRALNDEDLATLWVRPLGSASARELPETENGYHPFWSPDGRSIGFHRSDTGKLYRVDIEDGSVAVLADTPMGFGATWGINGKILFAPTPFSGLHVVPAGGGEATPVAHTEHVGTMQLWPYFLPDGNHFLFLGGQDYPGIRLFLGSFDPPRVRQVGDIRSRAEYDDGYLLFGKNDTVLAQRFDVDAAQLLGEPVRVANGVGVRWGSHVNYAFSVSSKLLLLAGGADVREHRLVSLDRQGRRLDGHEITGQIYGFAVSPNESMVAFERRDPRLNTGRVWTADLSTGVPQLLTSRDDTGCPVWSPDGSRILVTNWEKSFSIVGLADGKVEKLTCRESCDGFPLDWSPDGKHLVAQVNDPDTGYDLWVLPVGGDGPATPLLHSEYDEDNAHVSGDGQWVAYQSDESGRKEVYVQSFPDLAGKVRVSVDGGIRPLWREDGLELFYIREDGALMASKVVDRSSRLTFSRPEVLFQAPKLAADGSSRRQFAVLHNGERFIFNEVTDEHSPRPIDIVKNWRSLVEAR